MRKYVYKNDNLPKRPCNLCKNLFQMNSRFSRFCEPCKEGEVYQSYGYGDAYELVGAEAHTTETEEDTQDV